MSAIEEALLLILRQWGFAAEKIPESDKPTPDFDVRDDGASYFIELKTRDDDQQSMLLRDLALNNGELVIEHVPLIATNTASEIISKAGKQLKHEMAQSSFRVAWLVAIGEDPGSKVMQLEAALFGTTGAVNLDQDNIRRPCYFFRDSEFYRHRATLDAAMVSTWENKTLTTNLCLNSLSPRIDAFRQSKLCKRFGQNIRDPFTEEVAGNAYIADTSIPRANEMVVLDYLRTKYNAPKLINIEIGLHKWSKVYGQA